MPERLRLINRDDAEALAALQVMNRAYLAPWDPVRGDDYFTAQGQLADLDAALGRNARGEALPLVVLDDHGVVAGRLTLSGIVRGPFQSCSMGYWIAEERAGKGLATEAVQAALRLAFEDLGLHRVQAETLSANTASRHVLVKTGFQQYGLAPRYLKIAGSWQDHLMFQRLNDECQAVATESSWDDRVDSFWAAADDQNMDLMLAAMRSLVEERPEADPDALYEWASVHDFLGREAEAIPLYRAALDAGLSGDRKPQAMIQLASSLRNVGKASAAVDLLRDCPPNPATGSAAQAFLALALHDAGQADEALQVALNALAPTLPLYRRAVSSYADELTDKKDAR